MLRNYREEINCQFVFLFIENQLSRNNYLILLRENEVTKRSIVNLLAFFHWKTVIEWRIIYFVLFLRKRD